MKPEPRLEDSTPWEVHLKRQIGLPLRSFTFDMDDNPESEHLGRFPHLSNAIAFVNSTVTPVYEKADGDALRHQRRHRHLTKWAILSGTLALMLAIVQLGLRLTLPNLTVLAGWFEAIAVIAGVIAVTVGLIAKFDHGWFVQRHQAERLRMLKFQALGQNDLWCGKFGDWQNWIAAQVEFIHKINRIEEVKEWAAGGDAELTEPIPSVCTLDTETLAAFSAYYRWKRVEFQAAYFRKQAEKFRRQSRPLAHLGLPLFMASILAIGVHFTADWIGGGEDTAPGGWHFLGVWALVLAAVLPVASLCARAWLGAFQQVLSASLFEAKRKALERLSGHLTEDRNNFAATVHHIAHVEHFLRNEHREWLRLLVDTDWFL